MLDQIKQFVESSEQVKPNNTYWKWDHSPADEDCPRYVAQGSQLGDTLIGLDERYEGCDEDCEYIEYACSNFPKALEYIKFLLEQNNGFSQGIQ